MTHFPVGRHSLISDLGTFEIKITFLSLLQYIPLGTQAVSPSEKRYGVNTVDLAKYNPLTGVRFVDLDTKRGNVGTDFQTWHCGLKVITNGHPIPYLWDVSVNGLWNI